MCSLDPNLRPLINRPVVCEQVVLMFCQGGQEILTVELGTPGNQIKMIITVTKEGCSTHHLIVATVFLELGIKSPPGLKSQINRSTILQRGSTLQSSYKAASCLSSHEHSHLSSYQNSYLTYWYIQARYSYQCCLFHDSTMSFFLIIMRIMIMVIITEAGPAVDWGWVDCWPEAATFQCCTPPMAPPAQP